MESIIQTIPLSIPKALLRDAVHTQFIIFFFLYFAHVLIIFMYLFYTTYQNALDYTLHISIHSLKYLQVEKKNKPHEPHVKINAEIGGNASKSRECQRLPGSDQKIGKKHGTESPSNPQKKPSLLTP